MFTPRNIRSIFANFRQLEVADKIILRGQELDLGGGGGGVAPTLLTRTSDLVLSVGPNNDAVLTYAAPSAGSYRVTVGFRSSDIVSGFRFTGTTNIANVFGMGTINGAGRTLTKSISSSTVIQMADDADGSYSATSSRASFATVYFDCIVTLAAPGPIAMLWALDGEDGAGTVRAGAFMLIQPLQ